jgi:lipoprotein NlpD
MSSISNRFPHPTSPRLLCCAAFLAVVLLVGCTNPKLRAPVEDRPLGSTRPFGGSTAGSSATEGGQLRQLPGAENAGKPGYYTVKPGETLIRISLENGQNWRDVARWNNIENPNLIEAGQVLRVVPQPSDSVAAPVSSRPAITTKVEPRPLETKPAPSAVASSPAAAEPAPTATLPLPSASTAAAKDDDGLNWLWPASGALISSFDEGKNKGVVISGKAGDPVLASADGKVVYAGSGLRGYGNLVILKHNSTYLTAYAHNQTLLVKEEQAVRRGQRIAEMGSSDADSVRLHFEIRKQGKPIDPLKLLPPR